MSRHIVILLTFFSFNTFNQILATHLRGGYIQVKSSPGNSLTKEIIVFLLADIDSAVEPGHGEIDFGDGNIVS